MSMLLWACFCVYVRQCVRVCVKLRWAERHSPGVFPLIISVSVHLLRHLAQFGGGYHTPITHTLTRAQTHRENEEEAVCH